VRQKIYFRAVSCDGIMQLRIINNLTHLPEKQWRRLNLAGCPFLDYRFLAALEASGCAGAGRGWQAQHLALFEGEDLAGAMPLYLKSHSAGEFVFDWAWADAYERNGFSYYPKLVCAVPFTPVAGPRLLSAAGARHEIIAAQLIEAALGHARKLGVSSLHFLFPTKSDARLLGSHSGMMERRDVQFHWHNNGYRSFTDYLGAMSADKRKKIKRERRRVAEQGVHVDMLPGGELGERDWNRFYDFYRITHAAHSSFHHLNRAFFHAVGESMASHIVMAMARRGGEVVAGALFFLGDGALYGRYWGAAARIADLHFETCYYRPIEWCIENNTARFEAGAQGGHKLQRGLMPVTTRSVHWLSHPLFSAAVGEFLAGEKRGMGKYKAALEAHSPFRNV